MIDALAHAARIKPNHTGRVNHHNLLKLTGSGTAIASTLEFAIEHLVQGDTKKTERQNLLSNKTALSQAAQ
jgi:hypothetical protein